MNEDLIYRLRKRAEIRRQISTRKSVQEGKPDRISDLLEEAAAELENMSMMLNAAYRAEDEYADKWHLLRRQVTQLCEELDTNDSSV